MRWRIFKWNSARAAWLAVLLLSARTPASEPTREPFVLVRDGQPAATVVYAGDDAVVQAAAEDLGHYVEQISGAKLQVSRGVDDLPGPTLHLGATSLYRRLASVEDAIKLDGFAMRRVGEDLIIAGKIPQGTANGVATVLQDHFGVRWYYAGSLWETVPEHSTLKIKLAPGAAGAARVVNPSLLGRFAYSDLKDKHFHRRARLTLPGVKLPYSGTGHHLSRVVNPEKSRDRPEYFAYWDGKHHVEPGVHPCFTHPDMPAIFLDEVREGKGTFGVNDNLSACRCARCLQVDGQSEPYLGMVNVSESYFQLIAQVAKEAAIVRPDLRLGVFAYQLTNAPPKTVAHIGENVDVVLCQDTSQYFDIAHKDRDQRMSADWVKKCGHVRFYDYVGISYWTPRYFPHILADQIKHLDRIGVAGYGTHSSAMIDSSMPMYYLLSRLLWNTDLDPDALVAEMIADLYCESAGPIADFYAHWEAVWQRQKRARWLFGMDDFRGEMSLYAWDDFEKGQALLQKASALAKEERVGRRVAYLRERYAFTYESAKAFTVSMRATQWKPTANHEDAIELSNAVTDAWRLWADRFDRSYLLEGTPMASWLDKPCRVRVWALKQQMRDAVLAPLVRWVCANEGRIPPEELRRIEHVLAGVGMLNRSIIEGRVTERVEAVPYMPRVDSLLVADVPKIPTPPRLEADEPSWRDAGPLDAAPWVFLDRTKKWEVGKYEDPVAQHHYVMHRPPVRDDLSMDCQAGWDDANLYLRVRVKDERHVQNQPPPAMWKEDSIRLALNPQRDSFLYDVHSWAYIWGGYRGCELDLGVSLCDQATRVHVEATPERLPRTLDPTSLIRATARRRPPYTVYELAIDWRLLPDFAPAAERSLGLWLVVHDTDQGERISAEYGSAVNRVKRPAGFSAIRLVE
ncbi:MAG: DUF4838 domain-containing protein [Pirellulales bacterium]|nr:DUF4838 domain-containing protein [Pirellulales bacterium]